MRIETIRRLALAAGLAAASGLSGCGGGGSGPETKPPGTGAGAETSPPRDEIPPKEFDAALAAHLAGLGHMERYVEYPKAVERFREVHRRAPGFIPGSINLAIALLNSSGTVAEEAKEEGGDVEAAKTNFDEALELLDAVLARDPKNPNAHYCRGVILEYLGRLEEAHAAFEATNAIDPRDGHTWYKLGSTLTAPGDHGRPAGPPEAKELIELFTKALECNPYLVPALYKLQMAYAWDRQPARQKELLELWRKLNPKQNAAAPGDPAETVYGEMGKYAAVIDWSPRPKAAPTASSPPRFDVPSRLEVRLPEEHRWSRQADFEGEPGRLRDRLGAAVLAADFDGDNRLDLFLAGAVVGPEGVHDTLLLNRGDGRFEYVSSAWGLASKGYSLGAAAGDFDADGRVDLFLNGPGVGKLWRNRGDTFEDVTAAAGLVALEGLALTARWLDLDQDGDLDLYVVRHASNAEGGPGVTNLAYRNDGEPAAIAGRPQPTWSPKAVAPPDLPAEQGLSLKFVAWPDAPALGAGEAPHTGVAALDIDSDRDLDLVAVGDSAPPIVLRNDRLGRFESLPAPDLEAKTAGPAVNGVLVADFDGDARSDLALVPARGRLAVWRNRGPQTPGGDAAPPPFAFEFWASDAHDWRSAIAADLDLDGAVDLLGLPSARDEGGAAIAPLWARNAGTGLVTVPLALGPDGTAPLVGLACADLSGDPLPDLLLVRDGEGPSLARNLGNGQHWLALDLRGRWKFSFDRMRTNPHGLGAGVRLQGPGLFVPYLHTTGEAGLSQSVAPVVLGLGKRDAADLVRIAWPDGVMQCELNQAADQRRELAEYNRKTGSCPVLFTFDGERFVCIGDFLGGGGLGYLVAPGVYSEPDRDEAVAIAPGRLAAVDGTYRLSVTEPMDEVAYLDRLVLEVVDRPPGVEAAPEERFAPGGHRPSGELLAWRRRVEPSKVTDLAGRDLGDTLARTDRRTADGFKRLGAWTGYAEPHGIVLDFGDRLASFGPDDRLVLGLNGWVEYPYSQTNYAAATAGVVLQPPVLERLQPDGTWAVLEPDPGYPAGLPRLTLLDLTGKLAGERCVLRLRTNMECYWDEAFVAVVEPGAGVKVTALDVKSADLGARGYTREVSPDGRLPLLYDYDYIDPAPLARLGGLLTRFGDVAPLLRGDDDRLCLVGPGDEVRLTFDARAVPPLPDGWTRSFVLRSTGYCKDADPFTAASDTVGPLPWKGMGPYPFGPSGERPRDPEYDAYLREYQTRAVGGEW